MKERIESFDFIRAICAWIIVVYHFADICITTPQFTNFPFFYTSYYILFTFVLSLNTTFNPSSSLVLIL